MTVWPTVMVTGHRPQHLHPEVRPWVRAELDRLAGKLHVKFLHARNDGMIHKADAAIAVWLPGKTASGTASSVRKLTALDVPIIHVNPTDRVTTLRMPARRAA